jgi:hypothetical protein
MLPFFVWIIVTVSIGFLLITFLLPASPYTWPQLLLRLSLGVGTGFGITSGVAFSLLFIAGPSSTTILIADIFTTLILLTVCIIQRAIKKGDHDFSLACLPGQCTQSNVLLTFGLVITLLLAAYLFISISLLLPHGYWDSWGIWNLRARFLFRGGANWTAVFSPLVRHAEYPYLVSASVYRGWSYCGMETTIVPIVFAGLFTFATPALLMASLACARSISQGVIASLLLLGMPYFITQGAGQYADTPLAFYILATFISIYLCGGHDTPVPQYLICAGLTTGLACWSKNEGLLFLFSIVSARLLSCIICKQWKQWISQMAFFGLGLFPILMLLIYFKLQVPSNDLIYPLYHKLLTVAGQILNGSRYLYIIRNFIEQGLTFHQFIITPIPVLVIYLLCMGVSIRQQDKPFLFTAALCLGIMLTGYFFIYVITPKNLDWHIRTSLNRLLLHLWPASIFIFFLMIKSPEKHSQKGAVNESQL